MHHALITGASSGIGLELARIMAREGHHLILTARNVLALEELANELRSQHKVDIHIIPCDLSEPRSAFTLRKEIKDRNLTINCLVNNAGFGLLGEFKDLDAEMQHRMIELNCNSLMALSRLFTDDLIASKGRILNIASVAAFYSGPLMAVYYATKAFVVSFSEALNFELQKHGVSVTAHCPGPTHSNFQERAGMHNTSLFTLLPVPDSKTVAEHAYRAMMKRKSLAIHGTVNRMMLFFGALSPRSLKVRMVHAFQSSKS
ncbi:MAG: SDR family NAD(P)-dependent oxidoreductase [Candidatus Kapaibacteriota bacterium]